MYPSTPPSWHSAGSNSNKLLGAEKVEKSQFMLLRIWWWSSGMLKQPGWLTSSQAIVPLFFPFGDYVNSFAEPDFAPNKAAVHMECLVFHRIPIDILCKEQDLCRVLLGNLNMVFTVKVLSVC